MTWEIAFPVRDPSDPFDPSDLAADIATAISDPAERAVARNVVLHFVGQAETVGDVLDALEAASPAQRRALLNKARTDAGLRTVEREEQHRAFEAANSNPAPTVLRDGAGRCQALCGHEGCRNFEAGEMGPGSIAWIDCKRWYCQTHRAGHEAEMQPWRPRARYSRTGSIEFPDEIEAEAEHQRVEAESRRRREQKEAERRSEAERLRESEALRDASFRSEMPKGLRP
jgi:hypothetical protein